MMRNSSSSLTPSKSESGKNRVAPGKSVLSQSSQSPPPHQVLSNPSRSRSQHSAAPEGPCGGPSPHREVDSRSPVSHRVELHGTGHEVPIHAVAAGPTPLLTVQVLTATMVAG